MNATWPPNRLQNVAGLAATLAVRNHTTPARIEPRDAQACLKEKGIPIHGGDVAQ